MIIQYHLVPRDTSGWPLHVNTETDEFWFTNWTVHRLDYSRSNLKQHIDAWLQRGTVRTDEFLQLPEDF